MASEENAIFNGSNDLVVPPAAPKLRPQPSLELLDTLDLGVLPFTSTADISRGDSAAHAAASQALPARHY
jgi:hypothetical protein